MAQEHTLTTALQAAQARHATVTVNTNPAALPAHLTRQEQPAGDPTALLQISNSDQFFLDLEFRRYFASGLQFRLQLNVCCRILVPDSKLANYSYQPSQLVAQYPYARKKYTRPCYRLEETSNCLHNLDELAYWVHAGNEAKIAIAVDMIRVTAYLLSQELYQNELGLRVMGAGTARLMKVSAIMTFGEPSMLPSPDLRPGNCE